MISSRPILTSNDEGPIRGALIMARYLDEEKIEELSEITHLPLSIHLINDSLLPEDFSMLETYVHPLDKNIIAGFSILKDINGKPALVIEVEVTRDIYKQGQTIIHYFIISFLITGIAIGFISFLLFEKMVTSRIIKLSSEVNKIAEGGNVRERIEAMGEDEIGKLSKAINNMLDSIERSEKKIKELLKKEREFKLRTAHYFLNPLCIAKGYLQLALENLEENKIEKALIAIDRVERVIKNIIIRGEIKE